MIKNESFEELWKELEAESYGTRLAAEYPAWRTRRRRNIGIAAMALVTVGASLPLLLSGSQMLPQHDSYIVAYCNRADIADQYWVDMADQLLKNA